MYFSVSSGCLQTTIVITNETKNGSKERERWVGIERERKQLPDRYIPGMHVAKPQSEWKEERKKPQGLLFSARQAKGGKTVSLEGTCVQEETALQNHSYDRRERSLTRGDGYMVFSSH